MSATVSGKDTDACMPGVCYQCYLQLEKGLIMRMLHDQHEAQENSVCKTNPVSVSLAFFRATAPRKQGGKCVSFVVKDGSRQELLHGDFLFPFYPDSTHIMEIFQSAREKESA